MHRWKTDRRLPEEKPNLKRLQENKESGKHFSFM